ncbi:WD repeat-containing protein 75 [Tripterygium wilfordii]|uniref:WD repeat-containing protein 75 n=1 Tax=Tripterygium wilfordii TaxID=458696 RepID=A0A7J7D978_TRIWF|nr:WD repeat-containing protein 75 [Tripterygium wilfordii]
MIRGRRSYVSSPPALSNDAKRLLVCTGNAVSIFSTSTGLQIASLEGHTDLVTTVIVVPATSRAVQRLCYCWTASLDGTIRYWDFSVPELVKKIDIRFPVHSMVIPSILGQPASNEKEPKLFAYFSVEGARKQANGSTALCGHIKKCNLTDSRMGVTLAETNEPEFITISSMGKFFGIRDKRKIHIWKVPALEAELVEIKKITLHHTKKMTVLAFHPTQNIIAAGGKEGVLVVWQLDTGKKKFLPRIGSPLLYFTASPDPTHCSISCADNQIHLVKMPLMEIIKSISGIKLPWSSPELYSNVHNKVAFNQNAGLVALPTESYSIQLYSLYDDREISEVQVCERNHQPGDDVTVVVTIVALSPDGSMMSTAEVKLAEEGLGGLVCLKFWSSAAQNKDFSLTTIVYEPHRDAGISAVAFHPTKRMAVSSSYGGDFKVWDCRDGIRQGNEILQNSSWTCHAVGSYKKKPVTAVAFSCDGPVLAVAAETVITLWDPDPEKNVIVAIMGEAIVPIVNLSFIGNSEYLVAASCGSFKPQLSVWSMSKLSVSWSYKLHVEALACAMDSSSFAALALCPQSKDIKSENSMVQGGDGLILLFNAVDPIPVATWSVRKAKGGTLAFIQVTKSSVEEKTSDEKATELVLAYVTSDHEYVLFDPI